MDAEAKAAKKREYDRLRSKEYYHRMKLEQPELYAKRTAEQVIRNREAREKLKKEQPDLQKERDEKYNSKKKHDPEKLLKDYKRKAADRKLSFGISDNFAMMMFYDRCHYCHTTPAEIGRLTGIDRMDNKEGYEAGNVVPCCKRCNFIKGAMHYSDFVDMCKRMAQFHGNIRRSV